LYAGFESIFGMQNNEALLCIVIAIFIHTSILYAIKYFANRLKFFLAISHENSIYWSQFQAVPGVGAGKSNPQNIYF
jgi:hypothetical protein